MPVELRFEDQRGRPVRDWESVAEAAVLAALDSLSPAQPGLRCRGASGRGCAIWRLADHRLLAACWGPERPAALARRLDEKQAHGALTGLVDYVRGADAEVLAALQEMPLFDGAMSVVGADENTVPFHPGETIGWVEASTLAHEPPHPEEAAVLAPAPSLATNTIYGLAPIFSPGETETPDAPRRAATQAPAQPPVPLPMYGLPPPPDWKEEGRQPGPEEDVSNDPRNRTIVVVVTIVGVVMTVVLGWLSRG